jgi:hypothetical protein
LKLLNTPLDEPKTNGTQTQKQDSNLFPQHASDTEQQQQEEGQEGGDGFSAVYTKEGREHEHDEQ